MSVRAKFFVAEINHRHINTPGDVCAEVVMQPVYGSHDGDGDNDRWSRYTPAGELKMTITNPPALEQFELGKSYYLDFVPVDPV